MKYIGSKARIAKDILPIILKNRKENQYYVEPFVGGANIIDKVSGNRIGGDSNKYVIALLKELQKGWTPSENLSLTEYTSIRKTPERYSDALVAFASICCSFGAKEWGGYARGYDSKGNSRNYASEQRRHLLKQAKNIMDVSFVYSFYDQLKIPEQSIIYCDPPYRNTQKYSSLINYEDFYAWCRNMKQEGHSIFISEYWMPSDFKCLWSKLQVSSLDLDTGSKMSIEKLYTL